jgi:P2-related tail formation protein
LRAAEATDVIVRSFFTPPGPPAMALEYLDRASSIAGWLPVWRLEYPRELAATDAVLAAVQAVTSDVAVA